MIKYFNYVFFESKEDFISNVDYSTSSCPCLDGSIFFEIPKRFPATFRDDGSWDPHELGTWVKCDTKEFVNWLSHSVDTLNGMIKTMKKGED